MTEQSENLLAGRLVQWGLRPTARPAQEPEYRALLSRYQEDPAFRKAVRDVARGLGLDVLDASELGIVLAPVGESVFALKPSDFRHNASAEERLLDGLIQLAIAAMIFPKARDLQDDARRVRPPITVDDVETRLRVACDALARAAKGQPDPETGDSKAIYEAWRVFRKRPATRETPDGRQVRGATRSVIRYNFDRLVEFGCFLRDARGGRETYLATWRYQVLVQELAALTVFSEVQAAFARTVGEAPVA